MRRWPRGRPCPNVPVMSRPPRLLTVLLLATALPLLVGCASDPEPEPTTAPPVAQPEETPTPAPSEEPAPVEPAAITLTGDGVVVESESGVELASADFAGGSPAVRDAMTLAFGEPTLTRDEDGSACAGPHDLYLWAGGGVILADYSEPANQFVAPMLLSVTSMLSSDVEVRTPDGVRLGDPAASWFESFPTNQRLSDGTKYGMVAYDVVEGRPDIYGGGDPFGALAGVDEAGLLAILKAPTSFGGFGC